MSDEDAPQLSGSERGSPEPGGDLSASGAALQRLLGRDGDGSDGDDDGSLADDGEESTPEGSPGPSAAAGGPMRLHACSCVNGTLRGRTVDAGKRIRRDVRCLIVARFSSCLTFAHPGNKLRDVV